ncbi:hypothetical protein OPV22_029714 [Ensete ventricosum]|uniref:Uncharacterized protein n=1 Tax=Ensete ventricosum TaxID=4639 RepID=A0AAV8P5B3_ENSVE|nr:hypothetical protein OPV22_029714 [Ensete ventricosum]
MLKCSGRSRELCSPATNLSSYFSCRLMSTLRYWQLSYVYIAAEMLAIVISWLVVAIDLDWMADDWLDTTVQSMNVLWRGQLLNRFKNDLKCFKKRKAPESFSEEDLDERIRKQQEGEEDQKRLSRERKEEKKKEKAAQEETEDVDSDVMGFGGFRAIQEIGRHNVAVGTWVVMMIEFIEKLD